MKVRGLRTINPCCVTVFISSLILIVLLSFVFSIVRTIVSYNNFLRAYQFSTVPFWQDNRTINKKPLLPSIKVENVNLSNSTIVITACCRNVEKHLTGFQRNIKSIIALFGNYRIYFCESDSNDGTLLFLNQWKANDSDHVRVSTKGQQRWSVFSRKFN